MQADYSIINRGIKVTDQSKDKPHLKPSPFTGRAG